ncbi:hypothetical protein AB1Y20_003615 [Prymnesium parvum]|uniref:Inosine/uridine-preferring nucleoside hydrolase domain-containing protein n=1 Tax=Prymnesium parvum TaxID=97485 RepID=A0AB34J855_PRYPA
MTEALVRVITPSRLGAAIALSAAAAATTALLLRRRRAAADVAAPSSVAMQRSNDALSQTEDSSTRMEGEPPLPLVLITDPGQDLDDEMAFIMARHLTHLKLVELRGVITTLTPSFDRARLARGTLDLLGFHHVPVGVGTDGGDLQGHHTAEPFEESAATYMPGVDSGVAHCLDSGLRLLHHLYADAAPRSLVLLIIASMKDAALFARDNQAVFVAKTKEVVVMGGVAPWASDSDELTPDTANNNTFDRAAAAYLYASCQRLGVPFVVITRHAAYAAKMPRSVYDDLALTGSSIGWRLRAKQRASIEGLWARACAADPAVRKGLPSRCDRVWFLQTFCDGADDSGRQGEDSVWDLVGAFMQYDSIALLAAVPSLRARYFSPRELPPLAAGGGGRTVIGVSGEAHGVADAAALVEMLGAGFTNGLRLNHQARSLVILCLQARPGAAADTMLACLLLRAFWDLGLCSCLAILLSFDTAAIELGDMPPGTAPPAAALDTEASKAAVLAYASAIRATLNELGLRHVALHLVSSSIAAPTPLAPAAAGEAAPFPSAERASDILYELYQKAPPVGVTLVAASALTDIWSFAQEHTRLFHEKTVRVVHHGGALVVSATEGWNADGEGESREPTGEVVLEPDFAAQNHCLNPQAARQFYRRAQALSVPLVILSRHVSRACRVPRAIFDALEASGGTVGARVAAAQRHAIVVLWRRVGLPRGDAGRAGLPERCDRDWFHTTFCGGKRVASEAEVWANVDSLTLYSSIALVAALPGDTFENYLQATYVTVRGATHAVIGLHANSHCAKNVHELRSLLVQCFFTASRVNQSTFDVEPHPVVPVAFDDDDEVAGDESHKPSYWTFTDSEREELFDRTVGTASKNVRPRRSLSSVQ